MKLCRKCVYRVVDSRKNTKGEPWINEDHPEYLACLINSKYCKLRMQLNCRVFKEGEPLLDRIEKLEAKLNLE